MSNADVERQLADYFGWLDEQMGPVWELTDPEPVATLDASDVRDWRRWWLVAAAATLIGAVGGLVLVAGRDVGRDPVSGPVAPAGPLLGDVGDVGSDEWVYPSVLPAGVEYMFPQRENRTVRFAAATDQVGYTVSINPSLDDPGTEPVEIASPTSADIAGHTWDVVTTDDVWFATRQLESSSVTVSGPVEFDDAARAFIEGLVVIDEVDLPSPPLDFDGDVVEVARYDADGIAASVKVSESNGYYCIKIYDEFGGGGGGGCGATLDPNEPLSGVNFGVGPSDDGDGVRIDAAGIVSKDVTRVEIEFIDDTVIATTPTDLTGRFKVGFWVAAAETDTDVRLAEVRAYDSSGTLLATQDLR